MSERKSLMTGEKRFSTPLAWSCPIIISLRPRFAEAILNGEKTIEVRKTSLPPGASEYVRTRAFVYCTAPIGTVLGECTVGAEICRCKVEEFPTDLLLRLCITSEELRKYLGNKNGHFHEILNFKRYDLPLQLSAFNLDRPPQAWQYLQRRPPL